MTLKTRILTIALLVFCASRLPIIPAAAEEDDIVVQDIFAFRTSGPEAIIVDVNDVQQDVVVPRILGGCTVTQVKDGAFSGSSVIQTVTMQDGMRDLLPMSFAYFNGLRSVTLPSSLRTIGDHAFYHCPNLKMISIPNGVTTIGDMAFGQCDSLTTVVIPPSVTSIGEDLFYSISGVAVYAKSGSAAHSYALSHSLSFSELITVTINGVEIPFDQPPVIDPSSNRTLVPMRAILEQLGASVSWDAATSTATAVKGGTIITIQNNADTITVNGTAQPIDAPARIVNDRTVLPVRAISEAFGLTVGWDAAANTVAITA